MTLGSTTPSSSSSSSSKNEDAILIDSDEDISDASQSEIDHKTSATASDRPKRLLSYQKPDYRAEYAKYFGPTATAGSRQGDDEDDEDDEDYVISLSEGDEKDNDEHSDNSNDESGNKSTSSDRENSKEKESPKKEIKKVNGNENGMSSSGDDDRKLKAEINPKNEEIMCSHTDGDNSKEGVLKSEQKKQAKAKRKKRLSKKFKAKNDDSDMDTRKILDSFRNAQIVQKQPRQKRGKGRPRKTQDATASPTSTATTKAPSNTGPYVKLVMQKLLHSSDEYPTFVVRSNEKDAVASATLWTADNLAMNKMSYKVLVPRDRAPPVTVPSAVQHCSMCSNSSNMCHLGDLFGPYRVSEDYEIDMIDQIDEEKVKFHEVWLHESCAVWTPNIYLKNNRIHGIAGAVKAAQEMKCSFCKKLGASLSCRNVECNRIYHYPCAIKNECLFNEENFSILCKVHSSK